MPPLDRVYHIAGGVGYRGFLVVSKRSVSFVALSVDCLKNVSSHILTGGWLFKR